MKEYLCSALKKTILAYGLIMGLIVFLLKFIDYRFLVHDISMEIYIGIIAVLFTAFGIWMGLKLTRPKVLSVSPPRHELHINTEKIAEVGISERELEVLKMMSNGHSNQEIADKLFISLNTVKTHSSSIFSKLNVKRRTQAVQQAKEWRLIP